MRGLVALVAASAMLMGCGGGDTSPSRQSEATGTGQTPTETSEATTDPDTVQLLYISDSSGWVTADAYRTLAEAELGVPVELVDWRQPNLSMGDALERVRSQPEIVADAEIVVLWGNPLGVGVKEGHERCVLSAPPADPGMYTEQDWAPFADTTAQVLEAVWAARESRPTVLRVTDLYAATSAAWEDAGVWDACMTSMETMSNALRATAESHGATFVSALDVYNGPDHRQDPDAAGLLSGGIHPGQAGGKAMAEALAATGFEPTPGP